MKAQAGFSLIETVVALGLLFVVAAGVLPLGVVAMKTTENQGHLMARTTEYAQDKLEQLLALSFGDTTSDTRVFPATDLNGSGLTPGGSAIPAAPVALYVDYLDVNGTCLKTSGPSQGCRVVPALAGEPNAWFYKRVWQVTAVSATLKEIRVTAIVRASAIGGVGSIPQTTVVARKTSL